MDITTSEKIKLLLNRHNMTMGSLADATGQSRQNLSNKLKRNNFSEKELKQIANALDCDLEILFVSKNDCTKI